MYVEAVYRSSIVWTQFDYFSRQAPPELPEEMRLRSPAAVAFGRRRVPQILPSRQYSVMARI